MTDPTNPWQTHRTKTVYDNDWMYVTHSEVTNPNGGAGIYGVVHFKNLAIGIVPIDEEGNTWLVGQYRYPTDRYEWEIPEGGCPFDEDPLVAARRELQEETGLVANRWEVLIERTWLSNSITTEQGRIYVARDLTAGEAAPEETEALLVRKLPLRQAIAMAYSGEIQDALSQLALFRLAGEVG